MTQQVEDGDGRGGRGQRALQLLQGDVLDDIALRVEGVPVPGAGLAEHAEMFGGAHRAAGHRPREEDASAGRRGRRLREGAPRLRPLVADDAARQLPEVLPPGSERHQFPGQGVQLRGGEQAGELDGPPGLERLQQPGLVELPAQRGQEAAQGISQPLYPGRVGPGLRQFGQVAQELVSPREDGRPDRPVLVPLVLLRLVLEAERIGRLLGARERQRQLQGLRCQVPLRPASDKRTRSAAILTFSRREPPGSPRTCPHAPADRERAAVLLALASTEALHREGT